MSKIPPVVCPDCEQFVKRNIVIDYDYIPIWVCPECGVTHVDRSWYQLIDEDTMKKIVDGSIERKGLFVCVTGIEFIGIDSTGDEVFYEEFPGMTECFEWLLKDKTSTASTTKEYKVTFTETLSYEYVIEAESPEDAERVFLEKVNNCEIDFSKGEAVDSDYTISEL